MKKIPLKNKKGEIIAYAKVDDEDFEYLMQWTWRFSAGYAKRHERQKGKFKNIPMTSVIISVPKDKIIDHINGDRSDNRKVNLRVANYTQNDANRGKQINNTSGFKGVCWDKQNLKWMSQINFQNKHIGLGRFHNIKDAALAYNEAALKYFGEFAYLNVI